MAIEHADFEGIERLALVLGGEIVSTFGDPEKVKLGSCDLIEEVMIGEDKVGLLCLCMRTCVRVQCIVIQCTVVGLHTPYTVHVFVIPKRNPVVLIALIKGMDHSST